MSTGPFRRATYAIIKDHSKLIRYRGCNGRYHDLFEFYDLLEDPEEEAADRKL